MKFGVIKLFGYVGKKVQEILDIKTDFVGFDLIDVIKQVKDSGQVDAYVFVLDSKGGIVDVGKSIYNYMLDLDLPIYTINLKECASIATQPLLAGAVGNRYGIINAITTIHNPWIAGVSGDGDKLISVGNEIKEEEEQLLDFYSDATGTPRAGIQPLMMQDTGLSNQEAITLGFLDKEMSLQEATAMFGDISTPLVAIQNTSTQNLAVINPNKNKMSKTMTETLKDKMLAAIKKLAEQKGYKGKDLKSLAALAANGASTSLTMKTTDGKTITVMKDAADPTPDVATIGDTIQLDGAPAPSATLSVDDGRTITTDANSVILTITNAAQDDGDMEARAVAAEALVIKLEKELKTEKETVVSLNSKVTEQETLLNGMIEDVDKLTAIAALPATNNKGTVEETRLRLAKQQEAKDAKEKADNEGTSAIVAVKSFKERRQKERDEIAARVKAGI